MRAETDDKWQPRPPGELLWVHATTAERYLALCDVGFRLKSQRPDLSVLASWEPGLLEMPATEGCDLAIGPLPGDNAAWNRVLLDHWKPDICIWAGGGLRRTLMRQVQERGIDSLLVDVAAEELPGRKRRWLPDQRRRLLETFDEIMTPHERVRDLLQRTGLPPEKVKLTGGLHVSTTPPGCSDEELADVQGALGSRPVWLAAHCRLEELPAILAAHRDALRLLHRLVLVISLEDDSDMPAAQAAVTASGLQMADQDGGGEPDEFTQVLLHTGGNLGLWYRLAPVTLMAGSLNISYGGHNPLDAAALGSAVLYGPGTGSHTGLYRRLARAGAAEMVQDPALLGAQVIRLSAPDVAASMALAGWQVVTEGAGMTDHLLEKVQDMLDLREERYETT